MSTSRWSSSIVVHSSDSEAIPLFLVGWGIEQNPQDRKRTTYKLYQPNSTKKISAPGEEEWWAQHTQYWKKNYLRELPVEEELRQQQQQQERKVNYVQEEEEEAGDVDGSLGDSNDFGCGGGDVLVVEVMIIRSY